MESVSLWTSQLVVEGRTLSQGHVPMSPAGYHLHVPAVMEGSPQGWWGPHRAGGVPAALAGSLQCWQDRLSCNTGAHALSKTCITLLVLSGLGLRTGASPTAGKSPSPWAGSGRGGCGAGEAGRGLGAGSGAG